MANPWEQNAAPINNPAATSMQGAPAPSGVSANDTSVPWHPEHAPINNPAGDGDGGSVWESIKSNLGARVDALAAGMLQDEGSDRSRYAMKRAERSNQEARLQESKLSTAQKVGVGAADIGTGLALSAVPGVGPELTAAYFGAQGTADQLRQQAEEQGRYDIQKATETGIAQGAAGVGAGHAAGAVVGKLLPTVADKFVGQALTSTAGGAGGGASMQMISNIANGKDINEGVGEAILQGAIGGAAAHGVAPAVRAVSRLPKTLSDIQGAGAAEAARRNPIAEQAAQDNAQFQAEQGPAVQAGEGAIPTGAEAPEAGAIPTPESQWIPGSENLNPEQYGEYKGPTRLQPGQGFGPGAPAPRAPETLPEGVTASPKRGAHLATEMWKAFRQEGISGLVSPKGLKQMAETEKSTESLGLKSGSSLVKQAQETEGSLDILQQQLEKFEPGSPEYQQHVQAITNLSQQAGSAAAHTRANALAAAVDMPATARFHDVSIGRGVATPEVDRRNIAQDVHGMSANDIEAEHQAVLESRGSSLLGRGQVGKQRERFQTYESHYNATRDAYLAAQKKVNTAFRGNLDTAIDVRTQLRESEQPALYTKANDLVSSMKRLDQLKTEASNGHPIDHEELASLHRQIVDNATQLGVMDKFKSITGEPGVFNPTLDIEAWSNFNKRTRQMHAQAPKGSFKEEIKEAPSGLEELKGAPLSPSAWAKAGIEIATSAAKRHESVATQAKGAAMLKAGVNKPKRSPEAAASEETEQALTRGDISAAESYAETALNHAGVNTEGPTLAATPAEEVSQAAPAAPEITPHTQAHLDTLMRGAQNIVDQRNAVNVGRMAQRPEPIAEPEVAPAPEAAPVQEGPGAFAQGNETPTRLAEEQHAPIPEEDVPAINQQIEEAAQAPEAETAPEAPQGPGAFAEGNRRPSAPVAEQTPQEAVQARGEGVPQKPKAAVKPEAEEAPREPTQEETPATDKPVEPETTDFQTDKEGKVSETPEQRNKRVSDMAKRMIKDKTDEVIRTPIKKLSPDHTKALKMKAEAEGMKKGIKDVIDHAKDIADKEGVHQADVMSAVMSREGGIEALFRDGFGKDAIKGRMNTAVKAYKTERRQMAKQAVNDASEIVRNRLGEAKVGATREEMNDRIRSNLKSMGLEDKVIEGAFNKAAEANKGNYTARHVVNYARQIMKDIRAEAKGTKPAERVNHVAHSREQLHKHIDSLGVDTFTRSALRKVVANHTQVGSTGQRGALTEAETKAVMNDIAKTLADRAVEAKAALSKKPAGSPAAKAQNDKVAKIESAQEKAEQTKGSVEADLKNVRESEAKANEAAKAAEKRAQEAEAKVKELSDKMDSFVKDFEAKKEQAITEAKTEMRKHLNDMTTDQVEQVGKVVGEDLPDSVGSSSDPEYLDWKAKMDVAAEELSKRGMKNDANFLRHFSDMVDKGLKRLEELPDHRDLVITQTEYNQLRDMFNKIKRGGDLDVEDAGNVQMGTMGIKLRTLLLGDANARNKIRYNSDRLNAERRKALAEKEGTGSFGEASPDIVAKPAKTEAALTPKVVKAAKSKPALTEQEAAIKKQEAKIKRLQSRLNNEELWYHDDDRGTKWKVAQAQLKTEKYNLEQMKKGK